MTTATPTPSPVAPVPEPKKRRASNRTYVEGMGVIAPDLPTEGRDLMAKWALPAEAWREGKIKISRKRYASLELELVDECSVEDYNLATLAAQYGPGDYHLILPGHQFQLWKAHNCKVGVSPEYARNQGYGAEMAPAAKPARLADAAALTQASVALQTDAPLTVGNLSVLMEAIVERTVKAIQPPQTQPMGIEGMLGFWGAMNKMQNETRAETIAMFNQFQAGEAPSPRGGSDWSEIIKEALPALATMFAPKAPPSAPPGTSQAPALTYTEPSPEPPPMTVVPLSEAEAKSFTMAVNMLKPFAGHILEMVAATPDDQAIARELATFVPERLEDQLIALAKLAEERGPGVLGLIHPDLQTERGKAILLHMREEFSAEGAEN